MRSPTPLCPACGENDTVGPIAEAVPYLDNRLLLHLAPPGAGGGRSWGRWVAVPASAAIGFAASTVVPPFALPWSVVVPVAASAAWAAVGSSRARRQPPSRGESPHQRWGRGWWCERDRGVFVPGEPALLAPEDFSRWVRTPPHTARAEQATV